MSRFYKNGSAKVPLVNLSENDLTVNKGDTVTRGVRCTEITPMSNKLHS